MLRTDDRIPAPSVVLPAFWWNGILFNNSYQYQYIFIYFPRFITLIYMLVSKAMIHGRTICL